MSSRLRGVLPGRRRLAAWVAVLTAAAVLPVGLGTVVAPPAAAATTVTEFPLDAGQPEQVALAPDGTVHVSHWYDNAVSRITDAGTAAGPPTAVPGGPGGIVVAPDGTVYSAQWGAGGDTIARIAPDGTADPAWVSVPGGPVDLSVDAAGNLYTANYLTRTVSKVASDGTVTGAWATVATRPWYLASHPGGGVLMASYDGTVTRIDADGVPTVVRGATGTYAAGVAYAPDGTGYFADFNGSISRISADGVLTAAWVTVAGRPGGIAVDGDGDVYATLMDVDGIVKIGDGGTVTSPWVTVAAGFMPGSLVVDAAGSRVWAISLARTAIARVAVSSPPAAVGDLTATGQDRALGLSFEPPARDGGSPVTGYEVSTDGGTTWAALAAATAGSRLTATVVTGSDGESLVNGTSYDIVVRAVNALGSGAVSGTVAAAPVAPAVTAPGPPTEVAVVPGDGQAAVSWQPPADDGGAPVSEYTVVATPAVGGSAVTVGGAGPGGRVAVAGTGARVMRAMVATAAATDDRSCTTGGTSCTVTGLTNGMSYRFAVTATNSAGTSAPTTFAAAVVPAAPPGGGGGPAVPPAVQPAPDPAPATVGPPAATGAPTPITAPVTRPQGRPARRRPARRRRQPRRPAHRTRRPRARPTAWPTPASRRSPCCCSARCWWRAASWPSSSAGAGRPPSRTDAQGVARRSGPPCSPRRARPAVSAVQARTGTSRAAFMSSIIGTGKTISALSRAMPSAIVRAAWSTSIRNGIGNRFRSVIRVRTKPGFTSWTTTPCGASDPRRLSSRLISAALPAL